MDNKLTVLISPAHFNLSQIIIDEIVRCGYECKWFDDRPSKKKIDKMLLRLSPALESGKINRYFKKIVDFCKENQPVKLIVIIGQCFSTKHYQQIREVSPNTELVFYNWDAISNFPITKDNFAFFDRAYTFDSEDVKNFNLNFLPLFYSYSDSKEKEDLDYSLVVTVKKGKYADLHNIVSQLDEIYSQKFCFMYLQSKFVYRYYKLFDKSFKGAKKNDFSYSFLPAQEVESIFNRSKIVVDIVMGKQTGLTLRTIETLHLKKKLITNNEHIKEYPFYCEDNILICKNGDKINFDSPFFKKPFNDNYALSEQYSLHSFVKTLLGDK